MHKNPVITIARQFGSGGHEVGKRLASLLGIKMYDKELIMMAAEKSGYHPDVLSKADEKAAGSLLYTLAIGSSRFGGMTGSYDMPINDKLFIAQSEIIQELANEEQCVIIGRCGDYALRNFENKLSVFIYADEEMRIGRIMESRGVSESEAQSIIAKEDKKRSSYYNFYTGKKWGSMERYGAAFNTAVLGIEGTAELIADIVRSKN
ncbi:MAG: cytidylate kinase-like family protein [Clostridia bacterium]|nr:cytidylate kinase-like family protein [Clostridia bacterium]